ncbi:MAG: ISL3 family transposase [Actinomycetes bacterium]
MRTARVWQRLLGVEQTTVIERIAFDEDAEVLVAHARPSAKQRSRCGVCLSVSPGYDAGVGRRRWPASDLGSVKASLEAEVPRAAGVEHGVTVAAVPWARYDSRFTRAFEDTTTWLAAQASGTAVAQLLRVTWRTLLAILTRVVAESAGGTDRLAGLRELAIDEVAYRKGHRYLLATWNQRVGWITTVVADRAPHATPCMDPFHVVAWPTRALDEVRRSLVAELRRTGRTDEAKALKGTRWALLKNPHRRAGHCSPAG